MPRSPATSRTALSCAAEKPLPGKGVIEVDGLLWRAKPGSEVSAEEFIAARTTMIEIHRDARWNPWVEQDRADELGQAMATLDEWTRAEPDHRVMTDAEVEARFAGWDEEWKQEWGETCARREGREGQFDPDQATARLALLEQEAYLFLAGQRRRRLISHELFPAMQEARRTTAIAEEDERIARGTEGVETLRSRVGDQELVVDARGWLPSERRESALVGFSCRRRREVKRLREANTVLPETLKATSGREPLAESRSQLRTAESELAFWLAIPPLSADAMCSECEVPMDWHLRDGHVLGQQTGPCPWWPGWRARLQKAREMLLSFAAAKPAEPASAPPKPIPIVVLKSGTPIEELIERLTLISAEHPGAEVRRGSANRWEIWPPKNPSET